LGEDVEVVVARLPDVVLCSGAGEALFEDLNCQGQWGCFGFGDEEVNVVRHDDVAVDLEEVFLTGLFEDLYEFGSGFGGSENVSFSGSTEGDEVKVSGLMIAVQAQRH
jgi:hypothetical protein